MEIHQEGCEQHLVRRPEKKRNGQIHAIKTVAGLWRAVRFSDYDQ